MKTLQAIYHLSRADIFERTRRYGFLLILGAVVYLGVLVNNGTLGMELGSTDGDIMTRYHGELNSAWIGTMTVMVSNVFLGLFGFYLVSDCIKRDIRSGVGQIIATSPTSRVVYLLGKWISNFIVLSLLVIILALAAVVMVLLKSDTTLNLGALLLPFLAVALPYMALTAALAIVFETVPWLRGVVGNVIYFFGWSFSLIGMMWIGTTLPFFKDPLGNNTFGPSLQASASAAFPNQTISKILSVGSFNMPGTQYEVFNWTGVDWTLSVIGTHWLWVAFSLGLVLISASWFSRFDPSRERLRRVQGADEGAEESKSLKKQIKLPTITLPDLSPLVSNLTQVSPFLGVLIAELRLLLKGHRWWWWAITTGLNIAILTNSPSVTREYLLPIAWLWLLSILPEMGNREHRYNTSQTVFSAARPVFRQLPAAWLAGVLATALLIIAGAVYFIKTGDLSGLFGWVGGVIFVPSLALALGVVSSGNRVFEVVYVLWWYIGPLEKTPGLDFTSGSPQVYLLAAAGLILLTALWRGRQVRV